MRIKVGEVVIDIHEFDVSFIPGVIRMDATRFKQHGSFGEEELTELPEQGVRVKEVEPDRPVITREQMINEFSKNENNGEVNFGSDRVHSGTVETSGKSDSISTDK
jgi:hypothetical protein